MVKRDGSSPGESVYGDVFPDEHFMGKAGRHCGPGCIAMANSGPNTNSSQFYITTAETPWLDGKHVVFGRLADGMTTLLKLEALGTHDGRPKSKVIITNCGECP